MTATTLAKLLKPFGDVPENIDCSVEGLALDSRKVRRGDLFLAYPGTTQDGRDFIDDAIAQGAVAIVAEANQETQPYVLRQNIPIVFLKNLSQKVSQIAAIFFNFPAETLHMIGITGTNGKTSCAHFIAGALQQLGIASGVVGTLGNGAYGNIQPGNLTTPDAITLQALLANMVAQGVKVVAMEVSSHSLDQGRVNGIPFEIGIFTNLTRDHLDYHGDMRAYGAAKRRLFDNPLLQYGVINVDDEFGESIIHLLYKTKKLFAYGTKSKACPVPLIYADKITSGPQGVSAKVFTPWGDSEIRVPVVGQFNVSNLLAVLTALCLIKIPLQDALAALANLHSVPGRMQLLGGNQKPLVIVDYAHTPDAMEKALQAARQHCQGRLFCLFGCGGERDKGKRPLMAKIAEQYADHVVVTDDNPRHEKPAQIVVDIMQGFSAPNLVFVEHDRSKAIKYIIQCSKPGDCILLAGKGAETYQIIGDEKIAFSDLEQASSFLAPL